MSNTAYYEVLSRVQSLTPTDQLRLLEELAALVRRQVTAQPRRSILELQGLGKEIWGGIDAQEYVDRERASWNG
jgi:predicted NBD/HSP70 family sugar kinase